MTTYNARALLSDMVHALDSVDDPRDRLLLISDVQQAARRILAEQQKRSIDELIDGKRYGTQLDGLIKQISLGTSLDVLPTEHLVRTAARSHEGAPDRG